MSNQIRNNKKQNPNFLPLRDSHTITDDWGRSKNANQLKKSQKILIGFPESLRLRCCQLIASFASICCIESFSFFKADLFRIQIECLALIAHQLPFCQFQRLFQSRLQCFRMFQGRLRSSTLLCYFSLLSGYRSQWRDPMNNDNDKDSKDCFKAACDPHWNALSRVHLPSLILSLSFCK